MHSLSVVHCMAQMMMRVVVRRRRMRRSQSRNNRRNRRKRIRQSEHRGHVCGWRGERANRRGRVRTRLTCQHVLFLRRGAHVYDVVSTSSTSTAGVGRGVVIPRFMQRTKNWRVSDLTTSADLHPAHLATQKGIFPSWLWRRADFQDTYHATLNQQCLRILQLGADERSMAHRR